MVGLYGTLPLFPGGKAFTLMALQRTRMKQRPHTAGGLPSKRLPASSRHLVAR
jgi:hypothetical protein